MVNDNTEDLKNHLHFKELELNALLELTQAINANLPESSLYKIFHFTLIANLHIRKIVLYVNDEEWVSKVMHGTGKVPKVLPENHPILKLEKVTEIKGGLEDFEEFDYVVPVAHKSSVLAYLLLSISEKVTEGKSLNLSYVQTFSNIMMVAIENKKMTRRELQQEALRKELEIAREVQGFLFPKVLPSNILASYYPHDKIGGDYYDYIKLNETQCMICIADVSGKGIPAGLLMSNFQASLRTMLRYTDDLKDIIVHLNKTILENAQGEKFITVFLCKIDLKEKKISYINAGHNPPIYIHEHQTTLLEKGTTILGVFSKLPFIHEQSLEYNHGAMLFAYTDGVTEVNNNQMEEFGVENLIQFLKDHKHADQNEMHQDLYKLLVKYKEEQRFPDDITYLSFGF